MNAILTVAFIGMVVGFFLLFGISPMEFTEGIFTRILAKPNSIKSQINEATKRKKPNVFRREISEAQEILRLTNRTNMFGILCACSLGLSSIGICIAVAIGNAFLAPVMAVGLMFVPFWYVKTTATNYKKAISSELETALSIITTAYLRNEDIITSVEENVHYLNAPVKAVFEDFISRIKLSNPDITAAILDMKTKIDNEVFHEWCDSLIIVDFDKRSDDKTNANTLILGNSGQGKSYLLKLILTNLRESGKNIICLDPEMEYVDLTKNLGGCFIDLMSGEYIINVLEPKSWGDETAEDDAPQTFKSKTKLSQHISFLRDFFRCYKDFSDREIDTIELLLIKLYEKFGISDDTDWSRLKTTDYPILSDFYELVEAEYKAFNPTDQSDRKSLYTAENLRNICLGLHSICKGAESKFFDGHTNITDNNFVTFGVKGLLQASKNIRNALLFNVLAYMSEQLLSRGNTVASIDEFYLFLTNLTAVEYIRNFMKRVRKKESAVILASQNIEDFLVENVRELTKPLFSIPTHIFLFYPGTIEKKTYMDTLQVEDSEYGLIQFSQRGVCLYKCGNERYCLCVIAPEHKAALFGAAGGR